MLFTSLEFIFFFLPTVVLVNFILPKTARNYWIMFVSLVFYGWGEPFFLLIMLMSISFNYFSALKMSELKEEGDTQYARFTFLFAISVNILLIFTYKYMNFVTSRVVHYIPAASRFVKQTNYRLPIGISFFTFQAISYLIDVYRGEKPQKSFCKLALYISLFPQLIAGPIVRYNTIADQIDNRTVTISMFRQGTLRFLRGFNKKVLLSNALAVIADASWNTPFMERSVCMAWLGGFCYTLQIFFDFSGYSDMAIGLGRMFGFSFLENFNYPYISRSISEFWRRWHISLSSWFRDYVYFPLGGSRVESKGQLVFNLCVVWMLTGIWHGANWNFIAWGGLYAFFICSEKLFGIESRVKDRRAFRIFYRCFTLVIVLLLWVLFRSNGIREAWHYLNSMIGRYGGSFTDDRVGFYLREYRTVLFVSILCSTPIFKNIDTIICKCRPDMEASVEIIAGLIQFGLFVISISYLVMNAHNPFIYFNF